MQDVLEKIKEDPRYVEGLAYGKPRQGHEEGSVENHISELEKTLEMIKGFLVDDEYWKLKVLIHVHDSFKLEGKRRTNNHQVSLVDPNSHASLAAGFLREFLNDDDLIDIVQYHDEGHAIWKKMQATGRIDEKRLKERVFQKIKNMDLYLIFTVVDGFTESKMKDRSPRWFVDLVNRYLETPRVYRVLDFLGI